MSGPVPDPTGKSEEQVFVCERCGCTMPDRRKTERNAAGKS
jgi:hypothetical protein